MFDDQANNSTQDQPTQSPTLGLGINPNPTFVSPAGSEPTAPPAITTTHDTTLGSSAPSQTPSPAPSGDLEDIKRQALSQLSPLVSQLEQSPEEKYKTLMMMIQASDNHNLISEAYSAAQNIEDEKVKAEALLNIVNEINYFTQQSTN